MADTPRLHVREGSGTPVVLLHAILAAPRDWEGVARRLHAAGRTVAVVEDPPGGPWAPDEAADAYADAVAARLPAPVHLVGHSRGGTIASWIAVSRPDLVRSLAVVCSPPQATEAFRATFRRQLEALPPGASARTREALAYLARIPDEAFPTHALRRLDRPALVVEAEDDPLYSPTHTLFWRAFLPYAHFARVPGGHAFFAESDEQAAGLAARLLALAREAEAAPQP